MAAPAAFVPVSFATLSAGPSQSAPAGAALRGHANGADAALRTSSCTSSALLASCSVAAVAAAAATAASQRRGRVARKAELDATVVWPKDLPRSGGRYVQLQNSNQEKQWISMFQGDEPQLIFADSEKMAATMVGADVETGGKFWDPLNFHKLYDRNFDINSIMIYPHVQWMREAELKHGRCAMLAVVGVLAQSQSSFGFFPNQPDWTKVVSDCMDSPYTTFGILQLVFILGLIEGQSNSSMSWVGRLDREPGDFGFDPLKLSQKPNFDMEKTQLQELKNGRLAMIGFASLVANHYIPGSVPALTGFYATSPEAKQASASASGSSFCGQTAISAHRPHALSKTAARYTTQVILPSLTWVKSGVSASSLQPGEVRAVQLVGNDVLLGKDEGGKLFGVSNLCPHIGTPLSEGAEIVGDIIVCPLHGSSWSTKSGALIDWCVSPPIIGPVTGFLVEKKDIFVFDVRTGLFGGEIEVQVDTNAKKAYEADYWRGILDAQGKNDGSYY